MTDPEAPYYRHEITVVITTYQPRNDANALAEQIQQMLGPWCVAARVGIINAKVPPDEPRSKREKRNENQRV